MPHHMFSFMPLHTCYLLIALAVFATGCETNPYTDRSQLLVVPESQAAQMGDQAFQEILSDPEVKRSDSPEEQQAVQRVAERIIQAAKESEYAETAKEFNWEVVVIKDDQMANAFALPGGKIAVYTGIFPIAQNEAGLAAIMGHEVVHALARHGTERMSQEVLSQVGLTAASIGLGVAGTAPVVNQAAMAALGVGTKVGILLPYSRTHESEADYIGLLLSARAGYDPQAAVHVWQRMQQASQGAPPEFLSTHPSHESRIQRLQEKMPEAMDIYRKVDHAPNQPLPPVRGQSS